MLGVEELEKGEGMLQEALKISRAYPHPFLALAVNLYNQGRIEEALSYAKQGYDIDKAIVKSKEVYETLESRAKFPNGPQLFFYLSDL